MQTNTTIYGSNKEKTAYFYSLLVVNSGGLIINILAVRMFLKFRSELLSTNNNKLLFSMAVADLSVSIFGIAGAFLFHYAAAEKVSVNIWKLAGILPLFGSFFMSIFALGVMSFDRLIAVAYALRYQSIMTEFRTKLLIVSTWVTAAFIVIIQSVIFHCTSVEIELKVRTSLLTTFFLAGAIILIVANRKLYVVIRRKQHQIAVSNDSEVSSIDLKMIQWRRASLNPQRTNISNSLICIWMTAIFIACWFPITVYYVLRRNPRFPASRTVVTIATCLASVNSFLNPMVYLLKRKEFRKRFARFL